MSSDTKYTNSKQTVQGLPLIRSISFANAFMYSRFQIFKSEGMVTDHTKDGLLPPHIRPISAAGGKVQ